MKNKNPHRNHRTRSDAPLAAHIMANPPYTSQFIIATSVSVACVVWFTVTLPKMIYYFVIDVHVTCYATLIFPVLGTQTDWYDNLDFVYMLRKVYFPATQNTRKIVCFTVSSSSFNSHCKPVEIQDSCVEQRNAHTTFVFFSLMFCFVFIH